MCPTNDFKTRLHNGVAMPRLGLGVLDIPDEKVENVVEWALEAGYRSIDTAAIYGNEAGVGRAVRDSGIARDEIFVTTKVWDDDQGYEQTLRAYDRSLQTMGLDYVDLYLIHWAVQGMFKDTWRALEDLYEQGRVRAIGVCNFLLPRMKELLPSARIVPMVNQIEFHPYLQQPDLQAHCRAHEIQLEAWSPLMRGRVREIPALVALGNKYGKSPVQVTLRWLFQKSVVAIPKSSNRERIQENADIFDFEIASEDMVVIDSLDCNRMFGRKDPNNIKPPF